MLESRHANTAGWQPPQTTMAGRGKRAGVSKGAASSAAAAASSSSPREAADAVVSADADERRREQTRMAQRRYRMRKRQETDAERNRLDEDTTPRWFTPDADAYLDASRHPPISLSEVVANGVLGNTHIFTNSESMWAAYQMGERLTSSSSTAALCQPAGGSRTQSALHQLVPKGSRRREGEAQHAPFKLDFYRAYFGNAAALQFPPVDISKCKAPSRIRQIWHERTQRSRRIPCTMHPVEEQFQVVHAIAIDILPWPQVRRRILRAIKAGVLDHDTFKIDTIYGENAVRITSSPFRIHNLPESGHDDDDERDLLYLDDEASFTVTMDPANWECPQAWLERYWFLVDEEVIEQTNHWRRQQSLSLLDRYGRPTTATS